MPVNRQSIKCLLNTERYSKALLENPPFSKITHFAKQLLVPFKSLIWNSLVEQWTGVHLPMKGTEAGFSLAWEDPTCHRAPKPIATSTVSSSCWGPCAREPVLHNKKSHPTQQPAHRNEEESPLMEIRESTDKAKKTQHSQKIKTNNFLKHIKKPKVEVSFWLIQLLTHFNNSNKEENLGI